MKKQWKLIPGFPRHEVSNLGVVRKNMAIKPPFIYSLIPDKDGHMIVNIRNQGCPYQFRVARLVGQLFCSDYKTNLRPIYLDGNRFNCSASNLKWVSVSAISAKPYSRNPRTLKTQ